MAGMKVFWIRMTDKISGKIWGMRGLFESAVAASEYAKDRFGQHDEITEVTDITGTKDGQEVLKHEMF